jgi:hypothetical protein
MGKFSSKNIYKEHYNSINNESKASNFRDEDLNISSTAEELKKTIKILKKSLNYFTS